MTVSDTGRPPKQRTRRNLELFLLVPSLAVVALADFLVSVSPVGSSVEDRSWITHVAVMGALALGMNISLRIWAKYADPFILPIVVAINGIGLAMIHRLELGGERTSATSQLLYTGLGMACAVILLWTIRDHRILRPFTYIWLGVSAVLLVLPLVPGLGVVINGAKIWIRIGSFGIQPGEFAKITLALFFASYLGSKRDLILLAGKKIGPIQLPRLRDMAPMLVAWLAALGVLVFQKDLGSAILFFGLFMVMIYVATGRISWIAIGMAFIAAGGVLAMMFMSHVQARVNVWLNVFDPEIYTRQYGGSYQIAEGLFALSNGGIFGTGIGEGRPDKIPLSFSDMIYAALGEELGLVGMAAIVMLYLLLISRGLRAALGARDGFGKLLAVGLTATLCLQFFVVTAGVLRVMPLTGLTTPFLSAGGSSLLANWILVALLLLISHNARRPATSGSALSSEDQGAIEKRLKVQEASALDATPEQTLPSPTSPEPKGGAA
ncbi:MAG: FtsW/RodA/SpoVE family cell cycle protein [Galactobacter sp.]